MQHRQRRDKSLTGTEYTLPNETHPHENKIHYADMSAPKEYLLKHIQKTQVSSNINQIRGGVTLSCVLFFITLFFYYSPVLASRGRLEGKLDSTEGERKGEREKNNDLEKRDEK